MDDASFLEYANTSSIQPWRTRQPAPECRPKSDAVIEMPWPRTTANSRSGPNTAPRISSTRAPWSRAEIARIEGRELEAMRLYEQAIRSARDNGFVHHEALANELAGRFYLAAASTRAESRISAMRAPAMPVGGPTERSSQLDQHYPQLVEPRLARAHGTVAMRTEQLDLYSVTKASQTISGEIILDKLLRTLLKIVLEQGGAERACLVLCRDESLSIEAEAALDDKGAVTTILERAPVEGSPRFRVLVHYVQRTKERVILSDDANNAGKFAGDEYFARTGPSRSCACPSGGRPKWSACSTSKTTSSPAPSRPIGSSRWSCSPRRPRSPWRTRCCSQRTRQPRQGEGRARRAAFLAEAGAVLSESLDYEKTFARLGRLCVRSLCDWCVIDIVEGGEIRRVSGLTRTLQRSLCSRSSGGGILHAGIRPTRQAGCSARARRSCSPSSPTSVIRAILRTTSTEAHPRAGRAELACSCRSWRVAKRSAC